ncbi:MAG: hypothetical protein AAF391_12255, partial [Bacteroidota bacterium]
MRILISLCILSILISCGKDEEEYPFDQSPYVEFDELVFRDTDTQDALELSFIVWDEEGDIGLTEDSEDFNDPYHYYDVIIDHEQLLSVKKQNKTLIGEIDELTSQLSQSEATQ